jgi:hypothetical protein
LQYAHLPVALKTVPYDNERTDFGKNEQAIERELRAMDHPHVTRCFGFFYVGNNCKLVLERMDCSLQNAISAFSLIVPKSSNT